MRLFEDFHLRVKELLHLSDFGADLFPLLRLFGPDSLSFLPRLEGCFCGEHLLRSHSCLGCFLLSLLGACELLLPRNIGRRSGFSSFARCALLVGEGFLQCLYLGVRLFLCSELLLILHLQVGECFFSFLGEADFIQSHLLRFLRLEFCGLLCVLFLFALFEQVVARFL